MNRVFATDPSRRATLLQYGLAVLSVLVGTAIRMGLEPYVGSSVPYVTFFLTNALVIRFTRRGPSVLAILLSTFATDWFFLEPRYTLTSSPVHYFTSALFVVASFVMLAVAHEMRRAKEEAQAHQRTLQERAALLNRERNTLEAVMNGARNVHLAYLDRDFNFVRVNATYAKAYGFTPEAMVGKNHFALYPHPENEAIFVLVRESGQTAEYHDKPFEFPDQPERGVTYWDWTLTPVKDAADHVIGLVFALYETTARKRAELALRRSEERFRFLAESIPHLVWSARPDGFTDFYNARFLDYLGRTLEEVQGWTWVTTLHPDDLQHSKVAWERAVASGKEFRNECRIRRTSDGQYRWHMGHALPMRDAAGNIVRWYGTCTDIHDRREAEAAIRESVNSLEEQVQERTAKLRDLVQELEHLSFTITHDLRGPLRAMHGFAQIVEEDSCSDCEFKDYLRRITVGARRMDMLITDGLQYTRALRGELELVPVNVESLLRGIINSYPNLQPGQAEIVIEGRFPLVLGNEAALTQCFSNLLGNAAKFVAAGVKPRIRVRSESRGNDTVRLWIEDNGIGIAAEHLPKLFGMFQRATSKYEGTGIGLALVKKNVERMGGSVGVESEPGKGSRFWIELKEVLEGVYA